MKRARRGPLQAIGSALLGVVLLTGCARQHPGPEVGDSVTNWLHACSHDRDCRGEAMCLNAVCSVSCATIGADRCGALSGGAVCDLSAQACDLPCDTASACLELGADFICREGRCRESNGTSDIALAPAGPAVVPPSSGPFYSAGEAEWTADTVSAGRDGTFDPGSNFVVSTPSSAAAKPMVWWQADHWNVAWSFDQNPAGESHQFELAEVYPEGRFHSTRIATNTTHWSSESYVKGNDSMVARVGLETPSSCAIVVSDLRTGTSNRPSKLDCSTLFGFEAAPIPDSDEWLIAWPSLGAPPRDVLGHTLVRHDAKRASFGDAWWFTSNAPGDYFAGIAVLDGDVWAWAPTAEGGRYDLYRLPDAARPTVATSFSPELIKVASLERDIDAIVAVPDGVVVFDLEQLRLELRAVMIQGEVVSEPTPLASEVYSAVAAYLPERNQIALCMVSHDVTLLILDEHGIPTQPLVLLEENAIASTCDLAWSGSELLVVWGAERVLISPPVDGPAPVPVNTPLSARIVPLSVVLL